MSIVEEMARHPGADAVDHSIVIPTRNHPDRLATCLASILETPSSWEYEVLVLDNSDQQLRDANAAAVSTCADARVRYIDMTGVGLMAARHQGVEEARGAVVSFVDDDEQLCRGWFDGVRSCLRDPGVALVTGPFVPSYEARPPSWLAHLWRTDGTGHHLGELTLLDCGDTPKDIEPAMVWGGNLTIRKRVFEEVKGSHPDYLPPPWEAFQGDGEVGLTVKVGAAGYRARYSPECAVLHAVPAERMTLEYLRRRAWFVGVHLSFTDVRREHGMTGLAGVPAVSVEPQRPLVRRAVGRLRRTMVAGMESTLLARPPVSMPERIAVDVRRQLAQARREGYGWHREQLRALPALGEYVCRPHFLGEYGLVPSGDLDPGHASQAE